MVRVVAFEIHRQIQYRKGKEAYLYVWQQSMVMVMSLFALRDLYSKKHRLVRKEEEEEDDDSGLAWNIWNTSVHKGLN